MVHFWSIILAIFVLYILASLDLWGLKKILSQTTILDPSLVGPLIRMCTSRERNDLMIILSQII